MTVITYYDETAKVLRNIECAGRDEVDYWVDCIESTGGPIVEIINYK